MRSSEFVFEKWSQKYKSSINCSHPKGFSQKAHCAGKNKQNESIEMEMVCETCGMCETHGNLNEIKKGQKDSNGYTKCWSGYHAAGTKKSATTGKQVRNCVPNEGIEEAKLATMRDYYAGDKDAKDKTKLSQMRDYFSKVDPDESPLRNTSPINMRNLARAGQSLSGQPVGVVKRKQYAEEDKKTECPPATQDIALNLKNRQKAINEYGYGPMNPAMPNSKFWMKKVDEWNLDSASEAKQSLCGNCAAFDVRQDTLDCIATGIDADNPQDALGVIDAGDLGYCKFLKFKCASRRTCDAWVGGGPLTDKPGVSQELAEEFDLIESIIEGIAEHNGVDAEAVWEDLESLTEDELYAFAVTSQLNEDWQKANKRDKTDGMSQKAVNAYRRENPGSKLKTAVTTKPGKLKKGGKASKRRKSYCSRSRGQMKMHNISCAKTPDKAICKARRRWNC
jgi:hypothetical protein